MKTFLFLFGMVALLGVSNAQTNSPAPATNAPAAPPSLLPDVPTFTSSANASNEPPRDIEISSAAGYFNLKTNVAVYTGDVHATYSDVKMTCELLTAKISDDRKDRNIVAERKVIIDTFDEQRNPVSATGDKAIYTYKLQNGVTNEVIELIGNAVLTDKSGTLKAEVIIWDLISHTVRTLNQQTRIHSTVRQTGTNQPATNAPSVRIIP